MLIAKLTVSKKDTAILYNSQLDIKAERSKGEVLEDGSIVRGYGTRWKSKEAKEKFDRLTAEENRIRSMFNRTFMRAPLFDAAYIIKEKGEAEAFIAPLIDENPELDIMCQEMDLVSLGLGLSEKAMLDWVDRIKKQLLAVPLGRGKEVDEEGLQALTALATCPEIGADAQERILQMIGELRVGKMDRSDLRRSISLMDIPLNTESLSSIEVRRFEPSPEPAQG